MISPKRYIVVSDIHGQLRLLENALKHSGFDKDKDVLVVAGDWCDIGGQTAEVERLLDELGATKILGNHEAAHIAQIQISPYDPSLDPHFPKKWAREVVKERILFAFEIGGVLVSHVGIAHIVAKQVEAEYKVTPTAAFIAKELNERLQASISLDSEYASYAILDRNLYHSQWLMWFRPFDWGSGNFYNGFKQVVGHTPWEAFTPIQQKHIGESGAVIIDPFVRGNFDNEDHAIYAVITVDGDNTTIEKVVVGG